MGKGRVVFEDLWRWANDVHTGNHPSYKGQYHASWGISTETVRSAPENKAVQHATVRKEER